MNVLELFAGVGGFRIGLENADKDFFQTKWSNQWEPGKKTQDAFEVYNYHFPFSENININISDISDETFSKMKAELIVAGFPCQDYSVARSKKNELGIEGKKGVLFWEIIRATKIIKPKYLILENVDRLLKAPSKQRGRDFAIMLSTFNSLGYSVEWRVINAAEYGRSQRRKRVFFFVYRNDTKFAKKIEKISKKINNDSEFFKEYLLNIGLFAKQFPIKKQINSKRESFNSLSLDIFEVSNNFSDKFWNSGIMKNGIYYTIDSTPDYTGSYLKLKDILQDEKEVEKKYFINDKEKLKKFQYLRSAKKITRQSKDGFEYIYSEGSMSEFDDINLPGRTMLTSEGSVNRSTHLLFINNKYRTLTPIEAERLQDFPDNWTFKKMQKEGIMTNVSDSMRMFFMGNALVTEIVRKIALFIKEID